MSGPRSGAAAGKGRCGDVDGEGASVRAAASASLRDGNGVPTEARRAGEPDAGCS